ncbi:MAG TPA: energy transducer TonB [Allosphingosinicella sp.]|jgi:TonB family protein
MTPLLLALLLAAPDPPQDRARTLSGESLPTLFSDADYPADALRAEAQGRVEVRLHIGADGIVSACDVIASSNFASLDSTTCRVLTERARFRPARDAAGKAVSDTVVTSITWKLAEDSGLSPAIAAAVTNLLACLGPRTQAALEAAPGRTVREAAEAAFPACRAAEDALATLALPEANLENGGGLSVDDVRGKLRVAMIDALEQRFTARPPAQ